MGKDSKHQRTKGGVQPSSSSRTAELLQKSAAGGGAFSFMAASAEAQMEFGVLKPQSTVLTSMLIDEDLPPEIRMVFRKLQKKDAITKIKALAELTLILGGPVTSNSNSPSSSREASVERPAIDPSDLEELSKSLLPHWTKAYQKLVLDDSRKVREQAQSTLTQICKNVGRNLAPHLKQLMPSWMIAQNDLYSPVATAARRAFCTVFPTEAKQTEVVKFCKSEMLRTIVDHLHGLFRGKPVENLGYKEKKKQQKKKGQAQDPGAGGSGGNPSEDSGIGIGNETMNPPGASSNSESTQGDGESYACRVSCAALQSLKGLIEQGLIDETTLEEVFGPHGLFWCGANVCKEMLVRRVMFDLLAILANYLGRQNTELQTQPSETDIPSQHQNFQIPSEKCTKFINTALSNNQKETLPSLWNAFLLLTLNGVLSDILLARKQLLTCCKHGFYSNGSQIGPSVLPLLTRIWEGFTLEPDLDHKENAKQEFSHDIIASTILGYSLERSLFEKGAIARTLAEIVGFLSTQGVINMEPIYQFIFTNITDLSGDFARLFGTLVKNQLYYDGLIEYGAQSGLLNTKEFGLFATEICSSPVNINLNQSQLNPQRPAVRRRVKFQEPSNPIGRNDPLSEELTFDSLPQEKQEFLQSLAKFCIATNSFKSLSVISRKYRDSKIFTEICAPGTGINLLDIDISQEEDKLTRLQLYLDFLQAYPEVPSVLLKFSQEFENFQEAPDFKLFLKELTQFTHLQPIKRWIRMSIFTSVVESLLLSSLSEIELQSILKFSLTNLFSPEFHTKIISILTQRLNDTTFFNNLSHILISSNFSTDLSPIYKCYWNLYFLKSVSVLSTEPSDPDLELIETVCFGNIQKLDPSEVLQILEKYLESCDKLKQIDILIEITKRLGFSGEMLQPSPPLKVKQDVLLFIGQSYCYSAEIQDTIDHIPKFSKMHRALITKAIFKAKLVLLNPQEEFDPSDCINPLLNVIYAQSISRIWEEIEKSGYFDKLNQELAQELDVVSSRLIEKIYESREIPKNLWELVNSLSESEDFLWQSKLPLRVLIDYCSKAELTTYLKKVKLPVPSSSDDFNLQVTQILNEFSQNLYKVKEIIPFITEKRVKSPDSFEFETLFKHMKNKGFVSKLLLITVELLKRAEKDDEITEEFLSLGSCWTAAWLKQTKNLNISSKGQLLFVTNLAKGVIIISEKARNLDQLCPKFVREYIEFHSSQIYPVIYSLYVQLNEDLPNNFFKMQTLFYVSKALVTCPSNTLAFIQPDSVKLCEIFGKIVGEGVSLAGRIGAYRLLRKVRYDKSGESELPIVPPVIGSVIRTLLDKVSREDPNDEALISYLLVWDALLKIQQGSNEFATYVRDQEYLLTPFLNTLFFSESIALENATAKNFEKEADLNPGSSVNLLHLGCSVVQRVLRNLPYTVRWWWNNQVTRQRDRVFVEKFIVKYLSSKLAAEELGSVKLREGVDDNVTIHCHSGCNELIAHYRIEETNVTLTVSLPLNHPLGPVTVKISDKKLHGRISHLLNTRSHSLSAGLKLWKENLDGLYKDVDECAICFFILHNVTKQIPKLGCKTCKKKFHAACLYKWFSTSNKSECPLCRNLF